MIAAEISLVAVTVGFGGLLLWVFWPGRRDRLESYGAMPLEDDGEVRHSEENRA